MAAWLAGLRAGRQQRATKIWQYPQKGFRNAGGIAIIAASVLRFAIWPQRVVLGCTGYV
jgi:hypothetical protein